MFDKFPAKAFRNWLSLGSPHRRTRSVNAKRQHFSETTASGKFTEGASVTNKKNVLIVLIFFATTAVTNCVLLLAANLTDEPQVVAEAMPQIFESVRLTSMCVLGATAGTLLRLCWAPTKELVTVEPRGLIVLLARKAMVSMVCGVFVTPAIFRFTPLIPEPDLLVLVSGLVAFCGDVVVMPILINLQTRVASRGEKIVDSVLGDESNHKKGKRNVPD